MALTSAYDELATRWDADAGSIYEPLARSLVAASPLDLAEMVVLDVGAGTGAVTKVLRALSARVVGADLSLKMADLARQGGGGVVVGDALALPFALNSFDGALAGFVLNHISPTRGLAEMARVVRPGGVVLVSTWAGGDPDPLKALVEDRLKALGWIRPLWYDEMKEIIEPIAGNPDEMTEVARSLGIIDAHAWVQREDLGIEAPDQVIDYRFAMPHIAPWAATLDPTFRIELQRSLCDLIEPYVSQWRPGVLILSGACWRD